MEKNEIMKLKESWKIKQKLCYMSLKTQYIPKCVNI